MTSATYATSGTTIEFDDVSVSAAEAIGESVAPDYDLLVHRSPVNKLEIAGEGTGTLQAYADGRWQDVGSVEPSLNAAEVVIPERFTGRNLHYGYHENHIIELMALHHRTGDPMFLKFAQDWAALAPGQNGTVPTPSQSSRPGPPPRVQDLGYSDGLLELYSSLDMETDSAPPPMTRQ